MISDARRWCGVRCASRSGVGLLLIAYGVLRQLDAHAEFAYQAKQGRWQEIALDDNITAGNPEIKRHVLDTGEVAKPA